MVEDVSDELQASKPDLIAEGPVKPGPEAKNYEVHVWARVAAAATVAVKHIPGPIRKNWPLFGLLLLGELIVRGAEFFLPDSAWLNWGTGLFVVLPLAVLSVWLHPLERG